MPKKIKNLILSIITVLISVLIVGAVVKAATGGLTPSVTPPSGTMHTLESIYEKLGVTSSTTTSLNPSTAPTTGTMHTLDEIYYKLSSYKLCNASVDSTTGLVWQNDPNISPDWQDASGLLASDGVTPTGNGYCDKLVQCGVTWRLPTKTELMAGLTNQFMTSPATLGGFQSDYHYWSSTPTAGYPDPGIAWSAFSGSGYVYSYGDIMSSQHLVRCVH